MFWKKKPTPPPAAQTPPPIGPPRPAPPPPRPASAPQRSADRPGEMETVSGTVRFANGDRSWSETFNVVDSLERVLKRQEFFSRRDGNTLTLTESGFAISPVLVSFKPTDDGGSQTTTVTRVRHPTLIPDGLFEYQHSTGNSLADALAKGFDQWGQTDLAALLDALDEKPSRCTRMEMSMPATAERPERHRRIVLGPVSHLAIHAPPPEPAADGEHSFCPCCLLTKSFEAFQDQVRADGTFGIRLFAMRNADGTASADCRVNGAEYEPGKIALRQYVQSWPDRGVEFRKQYVVVRSINAPVRPD